MPFAGSMAVKEVVQRSPRAVRVFEEYGIDYCCGGGKSLIEVCAAADLDVEEILEKLHELNHTRDDSGSVSWDTKPLSAITRHIVKVHHEFVRKEIPRIGSLLEKVGSRHGDTHPELGDIQRNFAFIAAEMLDHMLKEEQVLFPYIEHLEVARATAALPAVPAFGSVARPVECMMREHDRAGSMVREIRRLTKDYTPPDGACPTYRAMLDALHEFEQDLHRHVHLENNILFPKAVELEATACALA